MTVQRPRAQGQQAKEQIVAATRRLLEADGPGKVTVRRIAEEAGINPSLVHRYFGSVDEVYRAVSDKVAAELAASFDVEAASPEDLLLAAVDFYRRNPSLWMMIVRGVAEGADMTATLGERSGFLVLALAKLAQRRGVPATDADLRADVATALYLLVGELAVGAYVAGRGLPDSEDDAFRQRLRSEVARLLGPG
ncbi:MAG: TetR/AcrR family transcriptional regulator [Actinomycetes bacterium]